MLKQDPEETLMACWKNEQTFNAIWPKIERRRFAYEFKKKFDFLKKIRLKPTDAVACSSSSSSSSSIAMLRADN